MQLGCFLAISMLDAVARYGGEQAMGGWGWMWEARASSVRRWGICLEPDTFIIDVILHEYGWRFTLHG